MLLGEFAGIVYWFAICYWIQFVLEVHGGMGHWGSWGTFALFCVLKALHLALFSLLAAVLLKTRYAIPAIAALWTGIERTHGTFGFAWLTLGNAGIDMPLPLRLAPFVGVYGISFLFALTSAVVTLLIFCGADAGIFIGWPSSPRCCCFRIAAARNPHRNRAWWCNPTCPSRAGMDLRVLRRRARSLDHGVAGIVAAGHPSN